MLQQRRRASLQMIVELGANQHSEAEDLTGQARGYEYYEESK